MTNSKIRLIGVVQAAALGAPMDDLTVVPLVFVDWYVKAEGPSSSDYVGAFAPVPAGWNMTGARLHMGATVKATWDVRDRFPSINELVG